MFIRIETISDKKMIGKKINTALSENRTAELWKEFMPRRKEIKNTTSNQLFSIQIFDKSFEFKNFDQYTKFEKWAAVEVTDFDDVPGNMETYLLSGGLYAVFLHKGAANDFRTHHYIFNTWLPNSGYMIDKRNQFEVMGERYKGNDPGSEEEVWVPIKNI